jgi:hypothetical protein
LMPNVANCIIASQTLDVNLTSLLIERASHQFSGLLAILRTCNAGLDFVRN